MDNAYRSTERARRYDYYWYIDSPEGCRGRWLVRKCRETGHRFDDEHFVTGNYYPTAEAARAWLKEVAEKQRFRKQYLDELAAMKRMSPAEKAKYISKLEKINSEEYGTDGDDFAQ